MQRTLLTLGLCSLVVLVTACPARRSSTKTGSNLRPGKPVDMELPQVGGGMLRLSDFRGKPLVVIFFATWCVVCQVQVARLQPVRAALGNDRVAVLGVSLDLQRRLVPPFVQAAGFNFPVVYGDASMVRKSPLGAIRGVPRTIILDARGRPVADFVKPVDSKVLLDSLKPLLKK